jgi:hypothetical protein
VELFTKALNLPEAVLEEIMGRALCRYLGWDMPD